MLEVALVLISHVKINHGLDNTQIPGQYLHVEDFSCDNVLPPSKDSNTHIKVNVQDDHSGMRIQILYHLGDKEEMEASIDRITVHAKTFYNLMGPMGPIAGLTVLPPIGIQDQFTTDQEGLENLRTYMGEEEAIKLPDADAYIFIAAGGGPSSSPESNGTIGVSWSKSCDIMNRGYRTSIVRKMPDDDYLTAEILIHELAHIFGFDRDTDKSCVMDIEECEEKLPKSMKKKFLKSMKKESMDKTFPKSDETLAPIWYQKGAVGRGINHHQKMKGTRSMVNKKRPKIKKVKVPIGKLATRLIEKKKAKRRPTTAVYRGGRPGDSAAWMSHLPDSTPLWEMSIPGTHDSATYHDHDCRVGGSWSACRTQDQKVQGQLERGIRYLDVRLCKMKAKNALDVYHYYNLDTFQNILNTVVDFLKANPKETVIISYQGAYVCWHTKRWGKYDWRDFHDEMKPHLNYIYDDYKNLEPTLGDVRGQIVFWDNHRQTGYGQDNNKIKFKKYNLTSEENQWKPPKKDPYIQDLKRHISKSLSTADNKRFFKTYLSANSAGSGDLAWGPHGWAKVINAPISQFTRSIYNTGNKTPEAQTPNFGIVIMDFPWEYFNGHGDLGLAGQIIRQNWPGKKCATLVAKDYWTTRIVNADAYFASNVQDWIAYVYVYPGCTWTGWTGQAGWGKKLTMTPGKWSNWAGWVGKTYENSIKSFWCNCQKLPKDN